MVKDIKSHKNDVAIDNDPEAIEAAIAEGDFTAPDHRPDDPDKRIGPDETAEEVEERLRETGKIGKYRVYVDDESEVPDKYEVQEGAQGGLYYEVGESESSTDDVELEDIYDAAPSHLTDDGLKNVYEGKDQKTLRIAEEAFSSYDENVGTKYTNEIYNGKEPEEALRAAMEDSYQFSGDPDDGVEEVLRAIGEPVVGDYDVDTDFGQNVADAVNNGNVVSAVPAQDWRDHTGEINDQDLLVDALEQITDDGTKTAKDRIRQRLRSDEFGLTDEEIDQLLAGSSKGEFTAEDHEQWEEEFELPPQDEVDNRESLYDHDEADTGVTAQAMEVMELEDGDEAFITHYDETGAGQKPPTVSSRADPENRDRQMVTYKGGNLIGDELGVDTEAAVPPHKEGPDGAWVAVESFDGDSVWELNSRREVDAEHAMDNAAVQMILGNNDLHSQNVLVNEEGEFAFIDLDHSAGDLTEDDPAGFQPTNGERAFNRMADTLNSMASNSGELTPSGAPGEEHYIREELSRRCQRMAVELNNDNFKEQLRDELAGDYDQNMVENIIANIENFADPDTEVPH